MSEPTVLTKQHFNPSPRHPLEWSWLNRDVWEPLWVQVGFESFYWEVINVKMIDICLYDSVTLTDVGPNTKGKYRWDKRRKKNQSYCESESNWFRYIDLDKAFTFSFSFFLSFLYIITALFNLILFWTSIKFSLLIINNNKQLIKD